MSASVGIELWGELFLCLAAEVSLVAGLALVLARRATSAAWERVVWQGAVVSFLVLLALESTGAARLFCPAAGAPASPETPEGREPDPERPARQPAPRRPEEPPGKDLAFLPPPAPSGQEAARWERDAIRAGSRSRPAPEARGAPPRESMLPGGGARAGPAPRAPAPVPHLAREEVEASSPSWPPFPRWLPGLLWISGSLLLAARILLGGGLQLLFVLRRPALRSHAVEERVRRLAARVGLTRPVTILEAGALPGPVAFGLLRPAVALPRAFLDKDEAAQEAVLIHELAHLASRDPAWRLAAEISTALLWWHPLSWWARSRLHAAMECAADEAALLVEGGPRTLAASLLEAAKRLARAPSWVLPAAGSAYRSGLARRVLRLLRLRSRVWRPAGPRQRLAPWAGAVAAALSILWTTAWARPGLPVKGGTVMSLKEDFLGRSVLGLFVAAFLQAAPRETEAQAPPQAGPAPAPSADQAPRAGQAPRGRTPKEVKDGGQAPELEVPDELADPDALRETPDREVLRERVDAMLKALRKLQQDVDDLEDTPAKPRPGKLGQAGRSGGQPGPGKSPAPGQSDKWVGADKEATRLLLEHIARQQAGLAGQLSEPGLAGLLGAGELLSTARGGPARLDVVQLATSLTDAVGALKAARVREKNTEGKAKAAVISQEEADLARIQRETAESKVALLKDLARAGLVAAEADRELAAFDLDNAKRLREVGRVDSAREANGEAELRRAEAGLQMLRRILEVAESAQRN